MGNHGLKAVPSRANFLLVLFEGKLTAESAYKGLMEAGYATRWLPGQGLTNALRITIGTEAQTREIGRAHVCTPVTNAHLVCRLLLENQKPHRTGVAIHALHLAPHSTH